MDLLVEGIKKAIILIVTADPRVVSVTLRTLEICSSAVVVAMILGVPLGMFLALSRFPGRRILVALVNTGMGLPPVTVGLFVAVLLVRSGVFGFLELIYTPMAMVIAQVIIAFPIVAGLTLAAVQQLDPRVCLQALSLGASRLQVLVTLIKEARLATLAALMAGFGGIISEVGASMMTGGNIYFPGEKGYSYTQVLTTAIVEAVRKCQFDLGIALSIILLALTFAVVYGLTKLQQQGVGPWSSRVWK